MISYSSRPFAGLPDIPPLLDFARAGTRARPPGLAYWHVGDITWQLHDLGPTDDVRLWEDSRGLAGFAAFEPPTVAQFGLRPGIPPGGPLFAEMLTWAEGRRRESLSDNEPVPVAYAMLGERTLATTAFDDDTGHIKALRARGYEQVERFGYHYARSLDDPIPPPELPPGMRLRHATEADLDARIDLHRDAWSLWGPSGATVEAYQQLRTAPTYDEELDIVLEDADGRLVSYCICWADRENGIGEFEPVGTRPSHAGRGLGKQVLYEGFRRLRARGLHTAIVGTASVNERAAALYTSVGFDLAGLDHFWVKPL